MVIGRQNRLTQRGVLRVGHAVIMIVRRVHGVDVSERLVHRQSLGEFRRIVSRVRGGRGDEVHVRNIHRQCHRELGMAQDIACYGRGSDIGLPFAVSRGITNVIREEIDLIRRFGSAVQPARNGDLAVRQHS